MNYEIIVAFADGLILGILLTLIIQKIYIEAKIRKYEDAVKSALDKLLAESKDDLPIEKEDEILSIK